VLREERSEFVVREWPPERGCVVVDFGAQVCVQLGGDVIALLFREPELNGSEIAVE
jgi:hypothetical protein